MYRLYRILRLPVAENSNIWDVTEDYYMLNKITLAQIDMLDTSRKWGRDEI